MEFQEIRLIYVSKALYLYKFRIQTKLTNIFLCTSNVGVSIGEFFRTITLSLTISGSTLCICSTSLPFTSINGGDGWTFTSEFRVSSASSVTLALVCTHKINTSCILSTWVGFTLVSVLFTSHGWIANKSSWT